MKPTLPIEQGTELAATPLSAGAPGSALDEEMEQLINDIAENMNRKTWTKSKLLQCINWQQDQLCKEAQKRSELVLNMLKVITSDILPNNKLSHGGEQ